jgi:hypothetical protein
MTEVITRDDIATRSGGGVSKHLLPPYDYAALEPHIDARTMMLHHGKHHASYMEKLNTALETFPDLQQKTARWAVAQCGQPSQGYPRAAMSVPIIPPSSGWRPTAGIFSRLRDNETCAFA